LTANQSASCPALWHVLYTRHQHEKTVDRILCGKGFETFLPLYSALSRWQDRTKLLHVPLFPCYVFFKDRDGRWLDVLKTPGVHMIVSNGEGPAIVPEEQIEAVRRLTEAGQGVEPHPFLKTGDKVRIKCGALAGVEGFLTRKKNLSRLVVSVDILGKSVSTEIDASTVERVAGGNRRGLGDRQPEISRHGGIPDPTRHLAGPTSL
jgi:transcription antitermination factor NusG